MRVRLRNLISPCRDDRGKRRRMQEEMGTTQRTERTAAKTIEAMIPKTKPMPTAERGI